MIDENSQTVMFPDLEIFGYRTENKVTFFSAKSLAKELVITFPFNVLFFSAPFDVNHIIAVDTQKPNVILLFDYQNNTVINSIETGNPILQMHFSGKFSVAIYNLGAVIISCNPFVILHTLRTPTIPNGICISSIPTDSNHCLFTYEDEINSGSLIIQRIPSSSPPTVFKTSKSPIRCVAISPNCQYIVTTSEKGTIARLWSIDGTLIQESRRGLFSAVIEHVSFSPDSSLFCVSSNHQTSHIFKSNKSTENQYILPKAEVVIPLESSKYIRSYILSGNHSLCLINDSGSCFIYSIDHESGNIGLKSQIMLPTIVKFIN